MTRAAAGQAAAREGGGGERREHEYFAKQQEGASWGFGDDAEDDDDDLVGDAVEEARRLKEAGKLTEKQEAMLEKLEKKIGKIANLRDEVSLLRQTRRSVWDEKQVLFELLESSELCEARVLGGSEARTRALVAGEEDPQKGRGRRAHPGPDQADRKGARAPCAPAPRAPRPAPRASRALRWPCTLRWPCRATGRRVTGRGPCLLEGRTRTG